MQINPYLLITQNLLTLYDISYKQLYKELLWNSKISKKDLRFDIKLKKERIKEWQIAGEKELTRPEEVTIALRTLEIELDCLLEELGDPKTETDLALEEVKNGRKHRTTCSS